MERIMSLIRFNIKGDLTFPVAERLSGHISWAQYTTRVFFILLKMRAGMPSVNGDKLKKIRSNRPRQYRGPSTEANKVKDR